MEMSFKLHVTHSCVRACTHTHTFPHQFNTHIGWINWLISTQTMPKSQIHYLIKVTITWICYSSVYFIFTVIFKLIKWKLLSSTTLITVKSNSWIRQFDDLETVYTGASRKPRPINGPLFRPITLELVLSLFPHGLFRPVFSAPVFFTPVFSPPVFPPP